MKRSAFRKFPVLLYGKTPIMILSSGLKIKRIVYAAKKFLAYFSPDSK